MTAQDWTARWIWTQSSTANQWVAFRRSFILDAVPTTVSTRIAADTKYWLYINGELVVFEGGLKGGPTKRDIYYDQLDLAPYLRRGQNTVAVLVWHFGKSGYSHRSRGPQAGGMLFEAELGPGTRLLSDRSWRAQSHPGYGADPSGLQPNSRLSESNVYYDARRGSVLEGWTSGGFDDSGWAAAVERALAGDPPWNALGPRLIPLFRFTEIVPYVAVTERTQGGTRTIVGRLPSNLQITPYLVVQAPAGAAIKMETDYYMDGGAPNVRATYVTREGVQLFESLAWMSGTEVRYTIPSNVTVWWVGYRESGYDTRFAGSFTSDDNFFDRLWQKAARTLYVNMRDTYFDCPTRERAQWWGDVVSEIRAGAYVFDSATHPLGGKAIRELVTWRRDAGELSSPVPVGAPLAEIPQQMMASIWGAGRHYAFTGDSSWMAESYIWLADHLSRWPIVNGRVVHRTGEWDWQDWGTNIDVALLDNAWYILASQALVDMARARGDAAEEIRWKTRHDAVTAGFERFWDPVRREYRSPNYRGDTDDRGNALAVVAGVVPPERYAGVTEVLRRHLNASPYYEFYVLEALFMMKAPNVALDRIRFRYAPQVDGPTAGPTLWETWTPDARATRNHGWSTGPLYALSAYVAGVRPTAPGFSRFDVRPQLGSLAHVRATVPTAYGDINVDIDARSADRIVMVLDVPPGTIASVALPGETKPVDVEAGSWIIIQPGARSKPFPAPTGPAHLPIRPPR